MSEKILKIIIANEFEVLEVKELPLEDKIAKEKMWEDIYAQERKVQVFQVVNSWGDKNPPEIKVGDLLPIENNYHMQLLSQMKRKKAEKKSREEIKAEMTAQDIIYPEQLKIFLQFYKDSTLLKIKEELESCRSQEEEIGYRVMYNSFKMYRLRENTFNLAILLLNLVNCDEKEYTTLRELVSDFKSANFDKNLTKALDEMVVCRFAMERNEEENWFEDATRLWSAYQMFSKATEFLINFVEKMKNKTLFFQDDSSTLDWQEAGAMEAWLPLRILRYNRTEDKDSIDYVKFIR